MRLYHINVYRLENDRVALWYPEVSTDHLTVSAGRQGRVEDIQCTPPQDPLELDCIHIAWTDHQKTEARVAGTGSL